MLILFFVFSICERFYRNYTTTFCFVFLGFVLIANEILRKCKIEGEVQSLNECSDSFFVAVYEGILGEALAGLY